MFNRDTKRLNEELTNLCPWVMFGREVKTEYLLFKESPNMEAKN